MVWFPMKKIKPLISISSPCIIIPDSTGIKYFNQTGGYACHDLEVEGFIIPLNTKYFVRTNDGEESNCGNPYWNQFDLQEHFDQLFAPSEEKTKYNGHGYHGIDLEDVEYIEKFFKNTDFLQIRIDRKRLEECEEARIFVSIKLTQYDDEGKETEPFCAEGILTWKNSD